jgi:hypothetical protein
MAYTHVMQVWPSLEAKLGVVKLSLGTLHCALQSCILPEQASQAAGYLVPTRSTTVW